MVGIYRYYRYVKIVDDAVTDFSFPGQEPFPSLTQIIYKKQKKGKEKGKRKKEKG